MKNKPDFELEIILCEPIIIKPRYVKNNRKNRKKKILEFKELSKIKQSTIGGGLPGPKFTFSINPKITHRIARRMIDINNRDAKSSKQ